VPRTPGPPILPDQIMNAQRKEKNVDWNAHLELDLKMTDDRVDDLMEKLAIYSVSVSGAPHNRIAVTITLPATSISQAFTSAVAVIEHAAGASIVAAEILPTDEFDARSGLEPVPALSSVSEAAELLGVTKPRVNQMITEGKFRTARKVGNSYVIAYREVADRAGLKDPLDQ
jgi:excisionase family DNA binding protein